MKEIGVLLFSLMIFITLSCATTQPKGGANLVAKGRNSNLNGFGEITGRVIDSESKYLLPGANVILLDTKLGAATDRTGTYKILNVPVLSVGNAAILCAQILALSDPALKEKLAEFKNQGCQL